MLKHVVAIISGEGEKGRLWLDGQKNALRDLRLVQDQDPELIEASSSLVEYWQAQIRDKVTGIINSRNDQGDKITQVMLARMNELKEAIVLPGWLSHTEAAEALGTTVHESGPFINQEIKEKWLSLRSQTQRNSEPFLLLEEPKKEK